ncbi:MAG TPA: hypothetical protein VFT70_11525 [Nocardioides sp.]|nr:hypothetical protein [Nocardioides sp.]
MVAQYRVPDGLPTLSRGKHRSPRKGACFMEMASVLANEPWSDKPRCTDPLLAQLARLVNDHSTDANRSELAVMIPSVIGVHGTGLAWDVQLVAAVAGNAVPDVPEYLQRALAGGLIRCEELSRTLGLDTTGIRASLDQVPGAEAWARQWLDGTPLTEKQFRRRSAPQVIRCAVRGIATGAMADPDARLAELLRVGIDTARLLAPPAPVTTDWPRPAAPPARRG